ncbi:delta-lactam-biosynthetic de-N-acetylase [Phosphitispora fastidiosa]|uniref:delta-lactam-biosynthetic de-N-acetylase n=1 Tax=Phosphitispora fastidiosa TaxID=2837202 RepID=UPI001E445A5F|nr:polysaccharide deacetylase family protein [Phosphitispora fastidiosa]MBU7007882.1 peptidoglycan-N-acetylmuramic acid deacetylase [Phosphitispora fastidiosa]
MRNRVFVVTFIVLVVVSVTALNILTSDKTGSREHSSLIPGQENSGAAEVYDQKEGWGFVKSRQGKLPEVTAHQRDLVKKYDALFMGDNSKKQVTLTFDLGYEKEGLTPRILKILKENNVKASFFVTTHWIEKEPQLARQLISEGHIMGNHTVKHKSLPTLSDNEVKEEILGWEKVAKDAAGYKIKHKYMRPPMGEYSERTLKLTRDMGYRTAFWSVAIKDWLPMEGPQEAIKGITAQLHNGAVVLLHGNSEDVVEGLDRIIKEIRKRGYGIVPIYKI